MKGNEIVISKEDLTHLLAEAVDRGMRLEEDRVKWHLRRRTPPGLIFPIRGFLLKGLFILTPRKKSWIEANIMLEYIK